ncbi:MAG: HAD-IC family P-type ATPase [Gammaproteobacteria bacterium]|nr:HAD-IC family P-type ATPase [Gammaproteobacteria bacterium]
MLAITTAVALFWWRRDPSAWFEISLAVLVVSCPCALSLAVPTALSSAVARLMRSRILVTSGSAVETLNKATVFAFDKTGTLTLGRPRVRDVAAFGLSSRDALAIAAALEAGSEHPLAAALRGAAREAGAPTSTARELVNTPGEGVSGVVDGRRYVLGNRRLVESAGIVLPDGVAAGDSETGIFPADEARVVACFTVADRVRPESAGVVSQLKARGLRVALVSGDNESAARRVAAELGIDEVFAGCSPADKLEQVRRWQAAGEMVAMVGDGVNDAPVLAGADVSISAGGASAVAAASADIVVLAHDLAAVVTARDTAARTMRILRQNFAWAIGYNLLAIRWRRPDWYHRGWRPWACRRVRCWW